MATRRPEHHSDHQHSLRKQVADAVTDRVVNKALDGVADKIARHTSADDRRAQALLEAVDVWHRPVTRSRQPRYTRDELAHAAAAIADREGIAALSMRRLANELGAGTMTLYHYVRTKDELMALVNDVVMSEVIVPPGQLPSDWRSAMVMIAERTRAALERHPWVFDIVDDPAPGPNMVLHFEQSMQATADLPGTLGDRVDVISAVDEYVFGFCLNARNNQYQADPGAPGNAEMTEYVASLLETGRYPHLAALVAERGVRGTWLAIFERMSDPARFRRGLDRLLDGFEQSFATG